VVLDVVREEDGGGGELEASVISYIDGTGLTRKAGKRRREMVVMTLCHSSVYVIC
jgi:hypothetical protein